MAPTVEIDRGDRCDISRVRSHRELLAVYAGEGSGRVLVSAVAVLAVLRALAGAPHVVDLVAVAVVVGAFPFVEWLIHVRILHKAPGRLGPIPWDPARAHRIHHEDPGDTRYMMLRWFQALAYSLVLAGAAATVVGGLATLLGGPARPAAATAALVGVAGLTLYEWLHLLFHSGVTPKLRWIRTLRARHRLHHWRNERYWMGVTSSVGDRVLSTLPAEPSDVPRSSAARAPQR